MHIDNCSKYYHYGEISDFVQAECFLSDEDEKRKLINNVSEYLRTNSTGGRLYCFTAKAVRFPLEFRDKYYGLWKNISLLRKVEIFNSWEAYFDIKWYRIYYGLAELPMTELDFSLNVCLDGFMDSFLLISDRSFAFFADVGKLVKVSNEKFLVDYANLINEYCVQAEIITAIKGCNGNSINIFRENRCSRTE